MEKLSNLDKRIINAVMEAILVLRCLNPTNKYKAACLCCQIWQDFDPKKRPSICKRIRRLVENDHLPLEAFDPDENGTEASVLYKILP